MCVDFATTDAIRDGFALNVVHVETVNTQLGRKKLQMRLRSVEMARDPCPVCRGRMKARVSTPCKHNFCKRCLHRVYRMCASNTCPMCRATFTYYVRKRSQGIKIVFFT